MPKIRHQQEVACIYFITTCLENVQTLFAAPILAQAMMDIIIFGRQASWYYLYGFVVMPEHLHVALSPGEKPIAKAMQSIKGFSARKINEIRGSKGTIWQAGYMDFPIYKMETYIQKLRYIEENPVRAGLVTKVEDYAFSSAGRHELLDINRLFEEQ